MDRLRSILENLWAAAKGWRELWRDLWSK